MITGEPKVKKLRYIKYLRMVVVAMPNRSPIAVQTPKSFHSIKSRNLSIPQKYKSL